MIINTNLQYVQHTPGPFIDVDTGEEVGQHQGIHMWTIGQRCRIGGHLKPYFVAKKNAENQTIYVVSSYCTISLAIIILFINKRPWERTIRCCFPARL